ncbi:MAG: vWA domain-containing protein [Trueperaceae bacterium]
MRNWVRLTKMSLLGIGIIGLLVACGQQASVAPEEVQVNGVRVDRADGDATGTIELSISGRDANGNIVSSASVQSASVRIDDVDNSTQTFTPTTRICGDITATAGDVAGVLMMDETGSMSSQDPDGLRFDAAKRFVQDMRSGDVAAVARFSSSVSTTTGLLTAEVMQDFTSDQNDLNQAIDDTFHQSGLTPLWDAAHDSVTMLEARSEPNRIGVVMTDGQENASSMSVDDANQHARDEGVVMFGVGFGGASGAELDALVQGTGGFRVLVGDQGDIAGMFDTIFAATQGQGCIEVQLDPAPAPGTVIEATLDVTFSGGITRTTTFRVQF